VAHPDDRVPTAVRREVLTPLFNVRVPVGHPLADLERHGIAMICTFGDVTDVTWWREPRCPRVSSRPTARCVR
jgi:valyl-tRNA synthetase